MSHNEAPQARLTTVASFPANSFLENLAVRADNSVLVTVMNRQELWYVPPFGGTQPVQPVCIHSFEHPLTGIVEVEPEIFYLLVGELYTTHEDYLYRLDLRRWVAGSAVRPEQVCRFPPEAKGLNGCCLLAPGVVLVADCFAGLIWRLDPAAGRGSPSGSGTTAWDTSRAR